jgi:oligopeptide transport system permease protein
MAAYPWMLIGPSVFFSATLLALNLVGDALRDALDPKSVRQ